MKQDGHEWLSPGALTPHRDHVQGPEAVGHLVFKQMTILFKPARILFNRSPSASALRAARVMSTAGVSTALTCVFNPLRILFNRAASRDAAPIGNERGFQSEARICNPLVSALVGERGPHAHAEAQLHRPR